MNPLVLTIALLVSIPARLKGVVFGRNSYLGLGYDWLFVRLKGITLKNNVLIGRSAWMEMIGNSVVTIGDGTNIGRNFTLSCAKEVFLGKKCLLSYNVSVLDHDHEFIKDVSPMETGITEGEEIRIEDGCFIGAHSFILKGVHLGRCCVVGANSVVVDSFPDNSIIAGNPAKLLKKLNP